MALHLYFRPSFKRSLKALGGEQKKVVGLILEALTAYYQSNCDLIEAQRIIPRFFYKQLRKPYSEAGVERNIRIVIKREGEKCIAILAGNHNQIKRFLTTL